MKENKDGNKFRKWVPWSLKKAKRTIGCLSPKGSLAAFQTKQIYYNFLKKGIHPKV